MGKHIEIYADWAVLGGPVRMGQLQVQIDRQHEVFSFSYDQAWLASQAKHYHLDPAIELFAGKQNISFNALV